MSKPLSRWLSTCLAGLLFVILGALVDSNVALAAAEHGATESSTHTFGNSKSVAFVFWFFALCTIGGSIFVITRRNMVTAVMGMVGTFFAIAGLFLMLYASFLAVMQVLVYAGAIMVLFVFVIMILNRPEAEPWAMQGLLGKGLAALGLLYLFKRLASIVWEVKDTQVLEIARDKLGIEICLNCADPKVLSGAKDAILRTYEFGTVHGVGHTLFTKYLLPFEAVSVVLLVAVVGAIAIARPQKTETEPEKNAEEA